MDNMETMKNSNCRCPLCEAVLLLCGEWVEKDEILFPDHYPDKLPEKLCQNCLAKQSIVQTLA